MLWLQTILNGIFPIYSTVMTAVLTRLRRRKPNRGRSWKLYRKKTIPLVPRTEVRVKFDHLYNILIHLQTFIFSFNFCFILLVISSNCLALPNSAFITKLTTYIGKINKLQSMVVIRQQRHGFSSATTVINWQHRQTN